MSDGPTADQLLADAAWLRRLAATLAGNDIDADDLVQESRILAWQQRPATDRPLRPWLAKVIRDLAGMRRRSEQRRTRRELAAERQEVSAPDALLEQMRLHRLLVDLVLELDEPFRSAIVARFVEGRSAADIARSLGIPSSTVRARLREGLARLRARLDHERGERSNWAPAVLAFARGGVRVAKPVKATVIVLALIALFLGGATVVVATWHRAGVAPAHPRESVSVRLPHDGVAGVATIITKPPGWIAQEGAHSRRIAGRVIAEGAAMPGALVRLSSDASAIEQRADADGRFDFGEQPPTQYGLGATAPGKLAAIQHVDLRDPKATADRLTLELGACIVGMSGRVLDSSGTPIAHAQLRREDVIGSESDATGAYQLCVLRSALAGDELRVVVRASGYAAIDIALAGPGRMHHDFILSPEAVVEGRAVTEANVAVGHALVTLSRDEAVEHRGSERTAEVTAITDDDGRFRITGASTGSHRISARGRGYIAVATNIAIENDAKPVVVTMSPVAIVRGTAQSGGKPVAGVTVSIGESSAVSQSDGSFVLDDVPVGEATFKSTPYRVRDGVRQIHAGDNAITLDVETLGGVTGTVRRNGIAIAGARMMFAQDHEAPSYGAYTDDAGHFSIEGVEPGDYHGRADSNSAGAFSDSVKFSLGLGEHRVVDVELDEGARITGSVVDGSGVPVADAVVRFEPTGGAWPGQGRSAGRCVSDANGLFDCGSMAGNVAYAPQVYLADTGQPALHYVDKPAPIFLANSARVDRVRLVVDARRASIHGIVVDSSGAPVAEARITASAGHEVNQWPLPISVTNANGRFDFADVAPGTYALRVEGSDGARTAIRVEAGAPAISITLDPIACPHPALPDLAPIGHVVWDDRIELLGWNIPARVHLGEKFELAVYYRVLKPLDLEWSAFVHIDGVKGRANADHDPISGRCATSAWRAGDVLVDRTTTAVTTNAFGGGTLEPGTYDVWIGFFRGWEGGWQNMPVSDAPATMRDDQQRIRITTLIVE